MFRELVPNEKLVLLGPGTPRPERELLVTVEFKPDGDGTMLTLTHEQFADDPTPRPPPERLDRRARQDGKTVCLKNRRWGIGGRFVRDFASTFIGLRALRGGIMRGTHGFLLERTDDARCRGREEVLRRYGRLELRCHADAWRWTYWIAKMGGDPVGGIFDISGPDFKACLKAGCRISRSTTSMRA